MLVFPLFVAISSGLLSLAKSEAVDGEADLQRGQRIGITSSFSTRRRTRATSLSPNWSLVGCFSDEYVEHGIHILRILLTELRKFSTSTRALQKYSTTTSTNSPASCMSTCVSLGYSLAGVEYGE